MKIGILSDTHDRWEATRQVLSTFRHYEAEKIIHCGDVTSPKMMELFNGFEVFLAFGNGDREEAAFRLYFENHQTGSCGLALSLELAGKKIFVIHGDDFRRLNKELRSGTWDYVFTGHSHAFRDETIGNTRIINPGAVAGNFLRERSACILDIKNGEIIRIDIR